MRKRRATGKGKGVAKPKFAKASRAAGVPELDRSTSREGWKRRPMAYIVSQLGLMGVSVDGERLKRGSKGRLSKQQLLEMVYDKLGI